MSNKIYLLSLIRKYLSYDSVIKIMNSMVMPYLEYVYFVLHACPDRLITRLECLQNRGLRICLHANIRTSVFELHQRSRCLMVKNKVKLNTIKQMYRRINRKTCHNRKVAPVYTQRSVAPMFVEIHPYSVKFQRPIR